MISNHFRALGFINIIFDFIKFFFVNKCFSLIQSMQLPLINNQTRMQDKQARKSNKVEEDIFGLGIQVFKIESRKDIGEVRGKKTMQRDVMRQIENPKREKKVSTLLPQLHKAPTQKGRNMTVENGGGKKIQREPSHSKPIPAHHKIPKPMQTTLNTVKKFPQRRNLNKTSQSARGPNKFQGQQIVKTNHNSEHDVLVNFYLEHDKKRKNQMFMDEYIEKKPPFWEHELEFEHEGIWNYIKGVQLEDEGRMNRL